MPPPPRIDLSNLQPQDITHLLGLIAAHITSTDEFGAYVVDIARLHFHEQEALATAARSRTTTSRRRNRRPVR